MRVRATEIRDLLIVELERTSDSRGSFSRLFCDRELHEVLNGKHIAQINHSVTIQRGSIRGLHFQYPPSAEMKIVRCIRGMVFDVAVDLRSGSDSLLHWHGQQLSENDNLAMVIPEGFAHGFQSMEPNSELLYLHSAHYDPGAEAGVRYDDPRIDINWPLEITEVSDRDNAHRLLDPEFAGFRV